MTELQAACKHLIRNNIPTESITPVASYVIPANAIIEHNKNFLLYPGYKNPKASPKILSGTVYATPAKVP